MKEGAQFIPLEHIGTDDKKVLLPGTGIVLGKFYPPHKGHELLIDTAQANCNALTVVVCVKDSEVIPGEARKEWIQKIHPKAFVKKLHDTFEGRDNDSPFWAKTTVDFLHFIPEFAFTSEDYGEPWTQAMGNTHVLVDKAREQVPISGTKVRESPMEAIRFLEPCVASYLIEKEAKKNE